MLKDKYKNGNFYIPSNIPRNKEWKGGKIKYEKRSHLGKIVKSITYITDRKLSYIVIGINHDFNPLLKLDFDKYGIKCEKSIMDPCCLSINKHKQNHDRERIKREDNIKLAKIMSNLGQIYISAELLDTYYEYNVDILHDKYLIILLHHYNCRFMDKYKTTGHEITRLCQIYNRIKDKYTSYLKYLLLKIQSNAVIKNYPQMHNDLLLKLINSLSDIKESPFYPYKPRYYTGYRYIEYHIDNLESVITYIKTHIKYLPFFIEELLIKCDYTLLYELCHLYLESNKPNNEVNETNKESYPNKMNNKEVKRINNESYTNKMGNKEIRKTNKELYLDLNKPNNAKKVNYYMAQMSLSEEEKNRRLILMHLFAAEDYLDAKDLRNKLYFEWYFGESFKANFEINIDLETLINLGEKFRSINTKND